MNKIIGVLLITALASIGCGGHKSGGKTTVKSAWQSFGSGNYEESLNDFIELIPTQGSPAIVGAGWCCVRLGRLGEAQDYFAIASPADADGWAGWTFVRWGLDDSQDAIAKANAALQINASYIFSRDSRVDFHDLVWIQAASFFQLRDNSNCLAKIKILDANFSADLNGSGIDQILLAKLQSLGSARE